LLISNVDRPPPARLAHCIAPSFSAGRCYSTDTQRFPVVAVRGVTTRDPVRNCGTFSGVQRTWAPDEAWGSKSLSTGSIDAGRRGRPGLSSSFAADEAFDPGAHRPRPEQLYEKTRYSVIGNWSERPRSRRCTTAERRMLFLWRLTGANLSATSSGSLRINYRASYTGDDAAGVFY